jgi:hypothetical protein
MEGYQLLPYQPIAGLDPAEAVEDVPRAKEAPAGMDFKSLLLETADELQMPPAVLATIISYETAGTFDPMKRGPTTQWGQHRGLIQFGEPQAAENGVDFSSPEAALVSQLGRNGAVVKYFRANGWQPGMSELDAYSIVNAGAPGRYNASDANNGGAAGTVADKVRGQFGPHREKALALLGGEFAPQDGSDAPGTRGGYSRVAYAYANGRMTPEERRVYEEGVAAGRYPAAGKAEEKPQEAKPAQTNPLDVYRAVAQRRMTPELAPIRFDAQTPQATFAPLFAETPLARLKGL